MSHKIGGVGWGRRQCKVGVNRRICVRFSRRLFKVGVKTRKYGSSVVASLASDEMVE